MPKVGKKHFPYTKKGMAAAKKARSGKMAAKMAPMVAMTRGKVVGRMAGKMR